MKRKEQRYTRRLPAIMVEPSIYQKVAEIADVNDRSLGYVIRDALAFYLRSNVSKTNQKGKES